MAEARGGSGARSTRSGGNSRAASSARASDGADTSEQAAPFRGAFGAAAAGHVCPVAFCPVGMALTFAEAARPEVVQHLMAAGQELLLAVKAMIDARAEAVSDAPGFEHIPDPVNEAIGLDVGGTKIAGFRVAGDGTVLERDREPTPAGGDGGAVLEAMEAMAKRLAGPEVVAIGVGVAGLVEAATGVVRYGPNLPFREVPMRERLAASTGLPCLLDNDASAAGWAEFLLGAGRGSTDMLLVTVGTGIGGAIVSGGRPFRGAHGFAAEIGHVIVEPNGPRCGCGNLGCWEQVASGRAIGRLGRLAAEREPGSLIVELAGGDPGRITGRLVTQAATQGDPTAIDVLAEVGRRLGTGIAGFVNVLDPEVVVVGGGVADAGELLLDPAREAMRGAIEGHGHRPEVPLVAAQLGNDAGGIGAALLALEAAG